LASEVGKGIPVNKTKEILQPMNKKGISGFLPICPKEKIKMWLFLVGGKHGTSYRLVAPLVAAIMTLWNARAQ